jgi:hypothetical protein
MTEITKPYKRKTRQTFAHYNRRIVVILKPTDVIEMRLEGTRTAYAADIHNVFKMLARWHAVSEAKRKREARKSK